MDTAHLLPDLATDLALILVGASFFTSLISAAIGLGGGTLLLAIMASIMPAAALIPVHGVAQLGSNAGRAWTHRASIQMATVLPFALGSLAGVALGAALVVRLEAAVITTGVGLFVLYSLWGPPPQLQHAGPWTDRLGGAISSFLTMFFGATGPFVAALIRPRGWVKASYMGTFSACMVTQHSLKTGAFLIAGFDMVPWLGLLAAMIASGYAGTRLGTLMMNRVSEATFGHLFKLVVSLIALRLIYSGVTALIE